jgi:hypothetical protein
LFLDRHDGKHLENLIFCSLTGMTANTSRTFVFSGTASYQQWTGATIEVSLTSSGNDLGTFAQSQSGFVYVERDPNTLHSLELSVTGVQAEYFVSDSVNVNLTVTNQGPSVAPPRELSISRTLVNLEMPAGCTDEGWRIACPIPSLGVGATWTQGLTGTASDQGTNGYLNFNLPGHELETYSHPTSFYQSFPVHGFVGTLSAAFTPAPPSSFDIANAQTFTVVITNSGQYTSLEDFLNVQIDRPNGGVLGGITSSIQGACAGPPFSNPYSISRFCTIPAIAPGSSYSFSYTVNDTSAGRLRTQASLTGSNEYTGTIAYHEINTTNGLPLLLAWKPGSEPPSSPPGFVYGQSHPFAVDISNPNSSSKSFSLEVSIPQGSFEFSLSAPGSCSVTTNPVTYSPGDSIDRIATCPVTLAAGQTSSVFFSANFPECSFTGNVGSANCSSSVSSTDVKARVIGVIPTPLTKRVKVNQ